jgi:exodeoxyribonuclease VII large subunit
MRCASNRSAAWLRLRRLLPKLSDIGAQQQQRADDLGERLSRGLERRVASASLNFAAPAGALNLRLLRRLTEAKAQRLAAARLPVSALLSRMQNEQARLDALGRLADSLHPEAPLKRGFARVTDADGKTIMNVAAAQKAGQVALRFADGQVGAHVSGRESAVVKSSKPPSSKPPSPRPSPSANQGSLFGE